MAFDDLPDQATVQALTPFQGWWNDLVFGEGTEWALEGELANLLALESRISDVPIPQGDGDIASGRWASGRVVTLPFAILGDAAHSDHRDAWMEAFSNIDPYAQEWLAFRVHEDLKLVRARVVRRQVRLESHSARSNHAHAVVELKLADPRIYDGDAWEQSLLVPVGTPTSPGVNLPVAQLPINMSAPVGGSIAATNTGNAVAYPEIRVTNEVGAGSNITSTTIINSTTGVEVEVVTAIAAGQTLSIDMDALVRAERGPHIHIGGSSRYGAWSHPRELFGLVPGINIITADIVGGTPTVRMEWLQPTQ